MTIIKTPTFQVMRNGQGRFKLVGSMRYGWRAKNCVVEIPTGFKTDFASIPVPLRNLISINGRHRLPAVLHDYLYSEAGAIEATHGYSMREGAVERFTPLKINYSRKDADDAFLTAMQKEGVGWIKAALMYRAVRMFGGFHRKHTGGKTWQAT